MNYSKRYIEIIFGSLILIIVFIFLIYIATTIIKKNHRYYSVKTKFSEIGGLATGAPIMLKGVTVGYVEKIVINKEYNVEVFLNINEDINLAIDSQVLIKDTSFFSGRKVEIIPGKSKVLVKNGGKLINTVDYMYLEDKISTSLFNK